MFVEVKFYLNVKKKENFREKLKKIMLNYTKQMDQL